MFCEPNVITSNNSHSSWNHHSAGLINCISYDTLLKSLWWVIFPSKFIFSNHQWGKISRNIFRKWLPSLTCKWKTRPSSLLPCWIHIKNTLVAALVGWCNSFDGDDAAVSLMSCGVLWKLDSIHLGDVDILIRLIVKYSFIWHVKPQHLF